MKTQDLVVGQLYKDKMFPEQTFVYKGRGTMFIEDYDFDCSVRGPANGIICNTKQVLRDITTAEIN
jgi:hypothetical protein